MNESLTNRRLIGILYIAAAFFLAAALGFSILVKIFLVATSVTLFFSGLALLKPPAKKKRRFYPPRNRKNNGTDRES